MGGRRFRPCIGWPTISAPRPYKSSSHNKKVNTDSHFIYFDSVSLNKLVIISIKMEDYNLKTKAQLVALCKERGIRGHGKNGIRKEQIVQLIKDYEIAEKSPTGDEYDKMQYDDLYALCKERNIKGLRLKDSLGSTIATKEKMVKLLRENILKDTLYDFFSKNKPSLISKFVGDQNILKKCLLKTKLLYTWKCDMPKCPNTFEATPIRVYKNIGPRKYCDTCSRENRTANIKKARLQRSITIDTVYPFIKDIWSDENAKLPNEFSAGSNEKVKLKCPNKSAKHPDYIITVNRIQESHSYRCTKCVKKSSNPEMRIYSELKSSFKDVKWQQKIEGREADIIVEDLKLVIEVDGFPWHKGRTERDFEKNIVFEKNGYNVVRIRDSQLEGISGDTIICNLTELTLSDYNRIIDWINNKFKCNIVHYDEWKNNDYFKEIQVTRMSVKYENSIEHLFPESKDLWDYEKNYPLVPSNLSRGSCVETWLKCNSGHSWKRQVCHLFRTIKGKKHIMKCPECNLSK
jgi:very-short-patch-repair endonuclease